MPLRPTERALLKGAMIGYDTYEVYTADTEAEARQFLDGVSVTEQQYYVVVEVPGGVVARDRGGIYSPSAAIGGNINRQSWAYKLGKRFGDKRRGK